MITETAVLQKPKTATRRKKKRPTERPRLEPDRMYSRKDLSDTFGAHWMTFMRAYLNGHLEGCNVGRLVFHSGAQVLRWLESGGKTS